MELLSPNNRKKRVKLEEKKKKRKKELHNKSSDEEGASRDKWYSFKIRTYGNMPNMANLYYHSIVPLGNILLMYGGWQVNDASNSSSRCLNGFVYQLDISTKFCKKLSNLKQFNCLTQVMENMIVHKPEETTPLATIMML